ncbi:MAG TPA: hypothetical protein ENI23_01455 [bacterium]|nr:hypothetical protein [bacterium]
MGDPLQDIEQSESEAHRGTILARRGRFERNGMPLPQIERLVILTSERGDEVPPEVWEQIAALTENSPGLDPQTAERLMTRYNTGAAAIAMIENADGDLEFAGYQSINLKYDSGIAREFARIFGLRSSLLPRILMWEWGTALTREDLQGKGLNSFLKQLLEPRQEDVDSIVVGESWAWNIDALVVNMQKMGQSTIHHEEDPFFVEFASNLTFITGHGHKDIQTERRLSRRASKGEALMVTERVKMHNSNGRIDISESQEEFISTFGQIIMASDVKLAKSMGRQLGVSMTKVTEQRKDRLIAFLRGNFGDVYTELIVRYGELGEEGLRNMMTMVAGLCQYALERNDFDHS